MTAYYNEIDPFAAAWLRSLIAEGYIAPGEVDDRSITEVQLDDLRGFDQCHFFAGIGGWSLALRSAGWPDDRPVWTGSCPCQPFSAAGRGLGERDPRHLWPEFRRLIAECRPAVVFGEQVASRAGREWLAGVRADLEALGYAVGAADLCAASAGEKADGWMCYLNRDGSVTYEWERIVVGAPHIRQRLWWVADADAPGQRLERRGGLLDGERPACGDDADGCGEVRGLADRSTDGRQQVGEDGPGCDERGDAEGRAAGLGLRGALGRMGDTSSARLERHAWDGYDTRRRALEAGPVAPTSRAGPWSDYVWLPCADGKSRRIAPGIEPLAHGVPARVGRLRGYGNAIVSQVAATFIQAVMEVAA